MDDPVHKPYSSEFMEFLNINNFENHVFRLTCAYGHTLDLVLSPGDSNVDNLKVLSISSDMSDHDMVFFHVNFSKTYSFTKSTTFKKYQRAAIASHFHGIERTLSEIDLSTMSAWQIVQTHNDYISPLSSELCTEVNKDITVRNNFQRYDASIMNLRCQKRRVECRQCRVRTVI